MLSLLNPKLKSELDTIFYRGRFLWTYTLIGFLSIVVELIIFRSLQNIIPHVLAKTVGVVFGILFAFLGNAKLNFKIPKSKQRKAFFIFVGISLFSLTLNAIFNSWLMQINIGYPAIDIHPGSFVSGFAVTSDFLRVNFQCFFISPAASKVIGDICRCHLACAFAVVFSVIRIILHIESTASHLITVNYTIF